MGPAKENKPHKIRPSLWSRRSFFSKMGWYALGAAIIAGLIGFLRFLFPRVLFEPSTTFYCGKPEEYVVGDVSERFKEAHRVWIIRENEGFYALLAICTHLGCTPRWLKNENKFKCPCHGSGFTKAGINFEGPAPRPLERVHISLNVNGEIEVNKSLKYREEKGQWGNPGAFLKIK